jgi:hypothetical protein
MVPEEDDQSAQSAIQARGLIGFCPAGIQRHRKGNWERELARSSMRMES